MTTAELALHEPYAEIKTELAKLAIQNDNVVFDYADPKGEKAARSHIHNMRGLKGAIEKKRKELKADALEFGRRVDAVAKELTSEVVAMIDVHQEPLDRIAQEEADRKAAIQEAMDNITAPRLALQLPASAENINAVLGLVKAVEIDAKVYQERMAEATELKDQTVADLEDLLDQAVKVETERAELARLRAEAEERERKEREARIAAEAAAKAKADAEAAAQREREEAERKAHAERDAAAQREREAQARAEKAEREAKEAEARAKADADRRVREAEEAAERKAQAEREAQAKREANKKHVEKVKREAIIGIEDAIGIADDDAAALIDAIADGKVPHVSITF